MKAERRLAPGSTIGILGGGQLGRMLALAAARLGLRCRIYSDVQAAPAGDVALSTTVADYSDADAIAAFARTVDVVTYEFENVALAAAEAAAAIVPVYPPPRALSETQDRLLEKRFLARLGIPVAPFADVPDLPALEAAFASIGPAAHLKTRRFGYDGKGQIRLGEGADLGAALTALGGVPAVLEGHVAFEREISVVAVRGRSGEVAAYDIPENTHGEGILRRSQVPAAIGPRTAAAAEAIAAAILADLDYVGVIGVEMFVIGEAAGEPVLVNEIAPRVHNTGHWTIDACCVSQFENHVRAICGWPLGPTARHSDAEMINLIGREADHWLMLAGEPATAVHLYGKAEARPGRKMGHATRLRPRD
ncbi:MAG: 5-(carboxyamino)imidazole ribonucleotide synthase [Hyphomicrobiaceae bacterium]